MANVSNLKPGEHRLTKEEQSAGGKASVKARRRRKLLKEIIEMVGQLPVTDGENRAKLKALGIEDDEMTNDVLIVAALYGKAIDGDVSAFNSLRDTGGQKPVDKVENTVVAPKPLIDLTGRKKNGAR